MLKVRWHFRNLNHLITITWGGGLQSQTKWAGHWLLVCSSVSGLMWGGPPKIQIQSKNFTSIFIPFYIPDFRHQRFLFSLFIFNRSWLQKHSETISLMIRHFSSPSFGIVRHCWVENLLHCTVLTTRFMICAKHTLFLASTARDITGSGTNIGS